MKLKEHQEMLSELLGRTTEFPADGTPPAPSTFWVTHADLRALKPYGPPWNACKRDIKVAHHHCAQGVYFVLDELDPVNSRYECRNVDCVTYGASGMEWRSWPLRDILKMSEATLRFHFYVVLLEDESDLKEWPLKMVDVDDGTRVYGTTRPLTREELMEKRVKRITALREAAK